MMVARLPLHAGQSPIRVNAEEMAPCTPTILYIKAIMRVVDLIRDKRDGRELKPEELKGLIELYTAGDVPDYQIAAFLMAVFLITELATLSITRGRMSSSIIIIS